MEEVLKTLGFEVETKDSHNLKTVRFCLKKAAEETEDTEIECLLVVALTHGSRGLLYASVLKRNSGNLSWQTSGTFAFPVLIRSTTNTCGPYHVDTKR